MSLSAPKVPKPPKPPPDPASLGDPGMLKVGRFLRLRAKRGGVSSNIHGGATIAKTGSVAPTVRAGLE